MTTAQVVETSVIVNNSPIQDYVHPDDQTQPTFETSKLSHTSSESSARVIHKETPHVAVNLELS